jgi:mannose-6-phosphate isomerase-like protein (cupin superfamily)
MPTIIDLNAEAAKLAMSRGLAPPTTSGKRKGIMARLGPYRDGILLLGTSAGTGPGHWETHREDELIYILEGTRTVDIVCDDGPPQSFDLRAGMIAVIPQGAWHRFHSVGVGTVMSATIPGDHIDLDVDDPRTSKPDLDIGKTLRSPSIIDLNAELAKLTMFRGRTPRTTFAERKGSAANLAPYRDGILLLSKWSGGKTHWETHPADELVWALDGTVILDIVEEDRLQSHALGQGMMVVVPQGAWHRFHSAHDHTAMSVTVPGEHIDLDVDDPRQVARQPA